MKKKDEKKVIAAAPPEKYFNAMVKVYFKFHRANFKDEDGYGLDPTWNERTRGMESGGLKKIISFLRQIAEGKKTEWTEEYAADRLINFLKRAYEKPFLRKNFMCVMLNKYRADILSSSYNPHLVTKILEVWYYEFPEYARDFEKDKAAAEIIVGFLKQQYLIASLDFEETSVLASARLIFQIVKEDEWWSKKSLKSISNNLPEFVNRIKSKNGRAERNVNSQSYGKGPTPTSDSKTRALAKWGLKNPPTSNDR